MIQFYETTVAHREQGYSVQFLVTPRRSVLHEDILFNQNDVAGALGLRLLQPLPSPALLPCAVVAMLEEADAESASARMDNMLKDPWKNAFLNTNPELVAFAEKVAYAQLVPFEQSDPALYALATLAVKFADNPRVIGSVVGFAAAGLTPLLLVTVPLGIILCGAATSFSKVLEEEGVHKKLLRLLGVSTRKTTGKQGSIASPSSKTDQVREFLTAEAERLSREVQDLKDPGIKEQAEEKMKELMKALGEWQPVKKISKKVSDLILEIEQMLLGEEGNNDAGEGAG